MTTPRPKLDLFNESPRLVSKKCRTSTPSLKPPKPPTKSSKRQRIIGDNDSTYYRTSYINNNNNPANGGSHNVHDGSFSFGLNNNNELLSGLHSLDEYCRMYQQFEMIEKIGSGYFADVYKAKSFKDGQYYAIKKTSIPYTSNSDRLRKLQEVKNHQSLTPHPNCVRYYDSWEENGYLYIQTELCKTSLNGILESRDDHKLPEHIVRNYLLDLLLAVKHLHDHDLLHLDIKPDNIFISFDGIAKLGDFGLMCNYLDLNSSTISNNISISVPTSSAATLVTSTTTSAAPSILDDDHQPMDHNDSGILNRSDESIDSIDEGDSKYLASETMQGKFTKAADIFSLGITIFEVASGLDLPQRGEIYHNLRHNKIEDLYFNGLSAELVTVIKLMMEEDYTKRPTVDNLLQMEFIRNGRCIC